MFPWSKDILVIQTFKILLIQGPQARYFKPTSHISDSCDLELGKPVEGAHKLNDKVLNPCTLGKTSVKLADSLPRIGNKYINILQRTWVPGIPGDSEISPNHKGLVQYNECEVSIQWAAYKK